MGAKFIEITPENLASEHLCCIIRKKAHPGVEAKRAWLKERLTEGHVLRKLEGEKECAFIEYAPLETAWTPVIGENYLYIYCLWVTGAAKGCGYGRKLMEGCIAEAKAQGKSGICMLGAKKQKAWLSDQSFAEKFGFVPVDETSNGYELLALSLDGTTPRFAENAKRERIDDERLTIYYDDQCPFIAQRIEGLKSCCEENGIAADFVHVLSCAQAKALPCVFNNWAVFYKGRFVTVNQIDAKTVLRMTKA